MRILEVNHGSGEIHRYALLPGGKYTVGRKNCRLPLPNGDPSISRHHATVFVGRSPPHIDVDLHSEADVCVFDCSKHGTFVNKELIGRSTSCHVYADDSIKFGKRISARVLSTPLILVESSELREAERLVLRNTAGNLGALLLPEPVPSPETLFNMGHAALAFLYVTRDGYTVAPPTLLAMARGYHITTLGFVVTLAEALLNDDRWNPKGLPQPEVAQPASQDFPADKCVQPRLCFYDVDEFLRERPSLGTAQLQQYTFIIPDVELSSAYEPILSQCGGAVLPVSHMDTLLLHAYTSTTKIIAVATDAVFETLVATLKNGVQAAVGDENDDGEFHRSSTSRRDYRPTSLLVNDALLAAYTVLYRNGICVAPESNIKRAIFTGNASEITESTSTACLEKRDETVVRTVATATAPTGRECREQVSVLRDWTPKTVEGTKENVVGCNEPLQQMKKNSLGIPPRDGKLKSERVKGLVEASPNKPDRYLCTKVDEASGEKRKPPKVVVPLVGLPVSSRSDTTNMGKPYEGVSSVQESALLVKQPIVACVPSQMNISEAKNGVVKRQHIKGNKLSIASSSCTHSVSRPLSVEPVQGMSLNVMCRQKTCPKVDEEEEKLFDVPPLGRQCAVSQESSLRSSVASVRFCDRTRSNTPRSTSLCEPLWTPRKFLFSRTESQQQVRSPSVSHTARSARCNSSSRDSSRLTRCHTARRCPNDSAPAAAASHMSHPLLVPTFISSRKTRLLKGRKTCL